MEYAQEIINGVLLIFCIYLLVRVRGNGDEIKFNREHCDNYISNLYGSVSKLKDSDLKSLKEGHGSDIINMIISVAEAVSLESYGGSTRTRHTDNVSISTCRFQAGKKFDAKVNAAIQNSSDPRVDHLVKTKPDLFLRRFATEEVEVTRATSAGEETVKGSIGKIASTDRGAMIFEIISPEKGIVQVKHSEIINFKTKDK